MSSSNRNREIQGVRPEPVLFPKGANLSQTEGSP